MTRSRSKVVSGTPRDSLHMIDVIFSQDGGQRPDVIVSDTGSYSDLVFGLTQLLGVEYRPALADLPDQRGWRIDAHADYGPLNTLARSRIDLGRVRRHWPDILRVVGSIFTGSVRAYDVVRMLQRDGHPRPSERRSPPTPMPILTRTNETTIPRTDRKARAVTAATAIGS